jgi:hypothetical protein
MRYRLQVASRVRASKCQLLLVRRHCKGFGLIWIEIQSQLTSRNILGCSSMMSSLVPSILERNHSPRLRYTGRIDLSNMTSADVRWLHCFCGLARTFHSILEGGTRTRMVLKYLEVRDQLSFLETPGCLQRVEVWKPWAQQFRTKHQTTSLCARC